MAIPQKPKPLLVRPLGNFLKHKYLPVEHVVKPWFTKREIAMVSAYRGTGKTYFGLALAYAISTGGKFLDWEVPQPRSVLFVDGEMDPADLQSILSHVQRAAIDDGNGNPPLAAMNLRILSHADQEMGIPNLSDPDDDSGRKLIETAVGDAEVLILDNLSTLCHSGVENDAESWSAMQQWLVALRRADKTVLLVHHTGKPRRKNGRADQRGTSKREDVLNASILLFKSPAEWGQFTVDFTKARGFKPPDDSLVMIEHDKDTDECRLVRERKNAADRVAELHQEGWLQKDIAAEVGLSPPTVSRIVRKLEAPPAEQKAAA